jgi:hypothetical protein
MYSPGNPYFTLSEEGEKEFGHIFPEGVPLKQGTLIREARLENSANETDFVVYVDWAKLDESQQIKCLSYMSEKFNVDMDTIRARVESDGYFPLRKQFIIEAYDLRFFI